MQTYLIILPIAFLVAISQIIIKWRTQSTVEKLDEDFVPQLAAFLSDFVIIGCYVTSFFASFAWLYIITKLPLTTAFPIYIGLTFMMVLFGGWFILGEEITLTKMFAVLLIFSGIVIGVRA